MAAGVLLGSLLAGCAASVRDRLNIRNNGLEAIHYQVADLRGQLIAKGSLAGQSSLQISLGGIPAGLYFVRVYDRGKQILSRKIVTIPKD